MSDWIKCCNNCEHRHACYRVREDGAEVSDETSCVMWSGWIPVNQGKMPRDMEHVYICYNSPEGKDYGTYYYYKSSGFPSYVVAWKLIKPYMNKI